MIRHPKIHYSIEPGGDAEILATSGMHFIYAILHPSFQLIPKGPFT
uniref:Uncharacterized protein n=1 Tax=Arundo donax TaxID=35708 RepID=A0A0A8Y889_ARUDO